jgi:heme/copper-type cytochrome/quinol oxidase subunit 3
LNIETSTLSNTLLPPGKTGTWWFLASEIPIFGGLIASYIVVRLGSSGWAEAASHLNFTVALINTFLLLTSSMTIVMAHAAVQNNALKRCANFLGLTILLGLGFLGMKAFEYSTEISHGFLPSSGIFWSFYYGMTGLHALHVLAGVIVNSVLWSQAIKGSLARHPHRVELAGLYWHLVDIIWIFLFPLLYLA